VAIEDQVGAHIRERRIMAGLTQKQLAKLMGVTYQQVLKYERGINRVSAGRLYEIARLLSAPIADFYEGIGRKALASSPHQSMQFQIVRDFSQILNEKHQEAVSQVVRALAGR
jgi:transcriptional regulator with XRE-family HTH domain